MRTVAMRCAQQLPHARDAVLSRWCGPQPLPSLTWRRIRHHSGEARPPPPAESLALPKPNQTPIWEPINSRLAPPGFRFGLELDGSQPYTVLSGHGRFDGAAGEVTVPLGTRLFVFGTPGSGLTHGFANILETGDAYEVRQLYSAPHRIYAAGEAAPNLCLQPPTTAQPVRNVDGCLNPNVTVVVVPQATELRELLRADMGIVCWAACQNVDGTDGPMFGEEGVWSSDGVYFARPY